MTQIHSNGSGFDHEPRTRIVFGVDRLLQLGELARQVGGTRVLLVTDPGIEAAGHPGRAIDSLKASGLNISVFDQVVENPTTREVDACVEFARSESVDLIVGLGGGSSMDTAKGCNFLLTNGGRMEDYWGVGKATRPMLPLIAVPTTAGTGSECQSFALISDAETHRKMACGDPKAAPCIALLDPRLTLTQPASVAACTGIDAIAHALETSVTTRRTPLSWMYSKESFRATYSAFPRVFESPEDIENRGTMLLGAALAGTAIENSMLGAAHACANPLTARHSIIHGQAVGIMLPHVVRFNAEDPAVSRCYAEVAKNAGVSASNSDDAVVAALVEGLFQNLSLARLDTSLCPFGVTEADIPGLAVEAAEQWTGTFNPRPLTLMDFENLYRAALNPRAY